MANWATFSRKEWVRGILAMLKVRKTGRPAASTDPDERLRRVEVAECYVILAWPVHRVAQVFGCSERTVKSWTRLALSYPEGAHIAGHLDLDARRAS